MAAQPNQVIKRIGAGAASGRVIDTIPGYTALTGTVSSNNATDVTVLSYTGTDNWLKIFNLPQNPEPDLSPSPNPFSSTKASYQSRNWCIWLYVPSPQYLVRIKGITNTGTNTWALQMYNAVPDLINTPCNYVLANLRGYYWLNDGGMDGTVNAVTVHDGSFFNESQLSPVQNRDAFWDPVVVNATNTSFYVTENR